MTQNIQNTIGARLVTALRAVSGTLTETELGSLAVRTFAEFVQTGVPESSIIARTSHVHSDSLRESIRMSMRTARLAYQLNVAMVATGRLRKTLVRTQLIELGSACEGLLFDVVQSVGVQDKPQNMRPACCNGRGCSKGGGIDWNNGGMLGSFTKKGKIHNHTVGLAWLIKECVRMGAVDAQLQVRLDWLREVRNVIHPTLNAPKLFRYDLEEGKEGLGVLLSTCDATAKYKRDSHLI